jgi:hypothetical protein
MIYDEPVLLDGVLEFLEREIGMGACIILTTARSEAHRPETEEQLQKVGIRYHRLIMDITAGERWLINDSKSHMPISAVAHVVDRNTGLRPLLG